MNVGLVKGCLKTRTAFCILTLQRAEWARPKGFFLPWFIICWSVLAKTNSTGWAAKYCMHRNKFSWISWDGLFGDSHQEGSQAGCKMNWNLCILTVQGQNPEMAAPQQLNMFGGWGSQEPSRMQCLGVPGPANIYPQGWLHMLLFLSISEESPLWSERIRHLRWQVCTPPLLPLSSPLCLLAYQVKLTPKQGITSIGVS